ncbi:MAG: thiamine phosphate synthase [Pyrinomonadaceae bacterium MAG19_C2-C3]|nr:thiamine phosphate synthase [Pyrinomonadaceae bacterium MAG19_C2-C3]
MFHLPKLYAITDSRLTNCSHAAQVSELIAGGARLIQLRDKHSSPRGFYEDAREACQIARAAGAMIIINDRVDIALALCADGVHLGQGDLPPASARRLIDERMSGEKFIIGYSTHNEAQAIAAAALPVDYIAIGPVFQTASKDSPDPAIGIEGVRRVRAALDAMRARVTLVAIGGIDMRHAKDVLKAGANSVAVIGALLSDGSNIQARTREFLASLNSEQNRSS